jgi:micrococcal nuclease
VAVSKAIFLLSLASIVLILLLPSGLLAVRSSHYLPAEILSIIDVDTIIIRLQGHKERVRLIGIDAPECRPNLKAEKDSIRTRDDLRTITEMGQRATRYVKGIISPGDQIELELDLQQRDKYQRVLAYIWLPDGRMLNEEIVRAGYASLMTIPPNVRYHQRLQEAYIEAREGKRGLWSDWRNE